MSTGYIVFAHGSSVESANEAVRSVACELARAGGYGEVVAAFLEGGRPDLASAAGELAARGVSHVVVIPYFLTLGLHLQRDLPRIVGEARRDRPGLEIEVAPPLDGHPALVEALLDRARTAERSGNRACPAEHLPPAGRSEDRAGPVPDSMDRARTTERSNNKACPAEHLPPAGRSEDRAGPVRDSMDRARLCEQS